MKKFFFYPEQPLDNPANNSYQKRDVIKVFVNKTSLDWYNARLLISFKLTALNGNLVRVNDNNGMVNGAHSFIKKISFSSNGREVYDCNYANQVINIKNLLEYDTQYADSIASNEFYFLDTSINPSADEFMVSGTNQLAKRRPAFNKGFPIRKEVLGTSSIVNCEIPLNRYSFFNVLNNKLLPGEKFELFVEIENDNNLTWRTTLVNLRTVITDLQLVIPKFQPKLTTRSWSYLNEYVVTLLNLRQKEGIFKITNSISKPRHVFEFIINKTKVSSPANNPFLYNTFDVVNNKKLLRCYLTVNNDTYPINHYKPTTEIARIYRDVMAYNNFQGGLLNINNFKSLFPFIHFNLSKSNYEDVELTFHYELSGETNNDYTIFAIVLHEKLCHI